MLSACLGYPFSFLNLIRSYTDVTLCNVLHNEHVCTLVSYASYLLVIGVKE